MRILYINCECNYLCVIYLKLGSSVQLFLRHSLVNTPPVEEEDLLLVGRIRTVGTGVLSEMANEVESSYKKLNYLPHFIPR